MAVMISGRTARQDASLTELVGKIQGYLSLIQGEKEVSGSVSDFLKEWHKQICKQSHLAGQGIYTKEDFGQTNNFSDLKFQKESYQKKENRWNG